VIERDFDTFYEQHEQHVRMRVCHLLFYRPDMIDDVIQDTWLKIWRYLPTMQYQNTNAWVWLVTTNCVRDAMRYQKSHDWQRNSLENIMERVGLDERDELMILALYEDDPYEYIPERLDRQERYQTIWNKTSEEDKAAFSAYLRNAPVDGASVIAARRNFKKKMWYWEQKQERQAS